jgi:hypothetical protein
VAIKSVKINCLFHHLGVFLKTEERILKKSQSGYLSLSGRFEYTDRFYKSGLQRSPIVVEVAL